MSPRPPATTDWLRKALEPVFARPISARALRRFIIAAPAVVLVAKGPLLALLLLWAFAIWLVPQLYRELLEARSRYEKVGALTEAAEVSLRQAAEHRLSLERELQKATKALREAENDLRKERQRNKPDATPGTPNTIFRRVGLDSSAPRFAIEAARKAYRKSLHPDLQPLARKAEAERRFKEAEAAFDEIWRLRRL